MKKPLLILCLITSCISYAQSNLPACSGNIPVFWDNCIGTFEAGENVYKGEWRNGRKNGYGVLNYFDGSRYIGYFKNDFLNGKGKIIKKNGVVEMEGTWEDGQLIQSQASSNLIIDEKYTSTEKQKPINLTESEITEEKRKIEEDRRQLAEERRKLEEEKRKYNSNPKVSTPQDIKRQKCMNLGLAPNSADFQQCMN